MENKPENKEMNASEPRPEWVKPEVTEFDVNSTTMAATPTAGVFDGTLYS